MPVHGMCYESLSDAWIHHTFEGGGDPAVLETAMAETGSRKEAIASLIIDTIPMFFEGEPSETLAHLDSWRGNLRSRRRDLQTMLEEAGVDPADVDNNPLYQDISGIRLGVNRAFVRLQRQQASTRRPVSQTRLPRILDDRFFDEHPAKART